MNADAKGIIPLIRERQRNGGFCGESACFQLNGSPGSLQLSQPNGTLPLRCELMPLMPGNHCKDNFGTHKWDKKDKDRDFV